MCNKLSEVDKSKLVYLGSGSYGKIYEYKDKVIKFVKGENNGFLSEINILSRCNHCCIIPLIDYEISIEDNEPVTSLLLPRGENILKALSQGKITLRNVLRDLLSAVAYLHEMRIIHGDIKPDNIIFYNNHAVLIDFGLSEVCQQIELDDISHRSVLVDGYFGIKFSIPFRDPEVLSYPCVNLISNDLYSLGMTMIALYNEDRTIEYRSEIFTALGNDLLVKLYNETTKPCIVRPTAREIASELKIPIIDGEKVNFNNPYDGQIDSIILKYAHVIGIEHCTTVLIAIEYIRFLLFFENKTKFEKDEAIAALILAEHVNGVKKFKDLRIHEQDLNGLICNISKILNATGGLTSIESMRNSIPYRIKINLKNHQYVSLFLYAIWQSLNSSNKELYYYDSQEEQSVINPDKITSTPSISQVIRNIDVFTKSSQFPCCGEKVGRKRIFVSFYNVTIDFKTYISKINKLPVNSKDRIELVYDVAACLYRNYEKASNELLVDILKKILMTKITWKHFQPLLNVYPFMTKRALDDQFKTIEKLDNLNVNIKSIVTDEQL